MNRNFTPARHSYDATNFHLEIMPEIEDVIRMKEILRDPEILDGIPVFRGTRVPARNLFDYLSNGSSVTEFLEDFPTALARWVCLQESNCIRQI